MISIRMEAKMMVMMINDDVDTMYICIYEFLTIRSISSFIFDIVFKAT